MHHEKGQFDFGFSLPDDNIYYMFSHFCGIFSGFFAPIGGYTIFFALPLRGKVQEPHRPQSGLQDIALIDTFLVTFCALPSQPGLREARHEAHAGVEG